MRVIRRFAFVFLSLQLAVCITTQDAFADDWGFFVSPGSWGVSYNSGHNHRPYAPAPGYIAPPPPVIYQPAYPPPYQPGGYYPYYNPNPIVRRDVSGGGYYSPDGTWHSENLVEDRSASYYSPGRNQAITPPRTSVSQQYGPDGSLYSSEHTSWIGADGRPHSTTVDRVSTQDIWGNTHTDTHVTLKKKPASASATGGASGQSSQGGAAQSSPQASPEQGK
jgi:hypothetical protein